MTLWPYDICMWRLQKPVAIACGGWQALKNTPASKRVPQSDAGWHDYYLILHQRSTHDSKKILLHRRFVQRIIATGLLGRWKFHPLIFSMLQYSSSSSSSSSASSASASSSSLITPPGGIAIRRVCCTDGATAGGGGFPGYNSPQTIHYLAPIKFAHTFTALTDYCFSYFLCNTLRVGPHVGLVHQYWQ